MPTSKPQHSAPCGSGADGTSQAGEFSLAFACRLRGRARASASIIGSEGARRTCRRRRRNFCRYRARARRRREQRARASMSTATTREETRAAIVDVNVRAADFTARSSRPSPCRILATDCARGAKSTRLHPPEPENGDLLHLAPAKKSTFRRRMSPMFIASRD